jgi:tetratricopeptide (TPR) repeat protein
MRLSRALRSPVAASAVLLLLTASLPGCAKINELKAMKSFKDANDAYRRQDYKQSAELYDRALQANPNLNVAYFYLGNSYDNLWKPSKKGDPANDALLQKAAENYRISAQKLTGDKPEEVTLRTRSLQYLVLVYGPDKLNDPGRAEPVVERMIQMDPSDPQNYFVLAKIYEDAHDLDKAEQTLLEAKRLRPNDPAVYMQLAAFYNNYRHQFDKTIEALHQRAATSPNDPEAFYTIATYYWDKVFRDKTLKPAVRIDYVRKGLQAADRAIQIKPDYAEALVYKGLLLRREADLEPNRAQKDALVKQADDLQKKADSLRKQKAAG